MKDKEITEQELAVARAELLFSSLSHNHLYVVIRSIYLLHRTFRIKYDSQIWRGSHTVKRAVVYSKVAY